MRICKICGLNLPLEQFASAGTINNKIYFRHQCIKCYSKSKNNRKKSIAKWLLEYKQKQKCQKCGINDFRVLEFDHLDPKTKIQDVSNMTSFSKKNILLEIEKCQILCANCHRIKTYESRVRSHVRVMSP